MKAVTYDFHRFQSLQLVGPVRMAGGGGVILEEIRIDIIHHQINVISEDSVVLIAVTLQSKSTHGGGGEGYDLAAETMMQCNAKRRASFTEGFGLI